MKQRKCSKQALAIGIACTLAFSLTPDYCGIAHAAETGSEPSQATKETVNNGAGSTQEYALEAVTVEAKRPDWESKLSPGTVTIIRPDDYKGEQKTLADLLKDVPGVHVREVNGKGQYTTVSVRGSTAAQVGVFVDGVLFNLGGDAAADISTIPVKNVERIEVYRGYIPARFGGTYIGGVINVVTKRPTQSNVAASVGQSSWGGYTGSLQIDAPLGTGSLMVGINRDQSDGDIRYKNFQVPYRYGEITGAYERLSAEKLQFYNGVLDSLNPYLGISLSWPHFASLDEIHQATTAGSQFYNALMAAGLAAGYDADTVNFLISDSAWFGYDPDFQKKWWDEQLAAHPGLDTDLRYRRNNDYKNTDAIIKWQDDHWLAKATWKKIDRHLPWGIWLGGTFGYEGSNALFDTDTLNLFNSPKHQELTAKEALVGRRDTIGNLEWGWSVNYLDQEKRYRNEGFGLFESISGFWNQPLSVWSTYNSKRLGGAIDGSFKAGNYHLLEFMVNYSQEEMDVNGYKVTDYKPDTPPSVDDRRRFRNYFEQNLFNIQLQDTITLNEEEDLWLTPSIRYNSSTILGRSNGLAISGGASNHIWFNAEDKQKDDKVTWQTAVKKKVSDQLTLRSTIGSYYRLLNLYEIAGDGAGIIPRPKEKEYGGLVSVFPVPEEGTQWDVSAIWDDRILGSDANIQLTYFGRKSENLLQLYRCGYDYWCYTNTAKGRTNGMELQANLSWEKWDMDLAGTYMHTKAYSRDNSPTGEAWGYNVYREIPLTYTPEWEGSLRLTYRPDQKTAVYTELKYMDEMFVSKGWDKKQTSLTTIGLGVKHTFTQDIQLTMGVNDLFNKGPELRLVETDLNNDGTPRQKPTQLHYPLNTDCPTQGRTYYVTLQYKY